jgi:HTH-type transcriptional regulator / antitoxin HigA
MAKATILPAEVFQPGEYLRDELQARGWTQGNFARIIGRPVQVVNEIVNGKKRITVETAKAIGLALGTGPELWLNLENTYRLHTTPAADPAIAKRAAAMAE